MVCLVPSLSLAVFNGEKQCMRDRGLHCHINKRRKCPVTLKITVYAFTRRVASFTGTTSGPPPLSPTSMLNVNTCSIRSTWRKPPTHTPLQQVRTGNGILWVKIKFNNFSAYSTNPRLQQTRPTFSTCYQYNRSNKTNSCITHRKRCDSICKQIHSNHHALFRSFSRDDQRISLLPPSK